MIEVKFYKSKKKIISFDFFFCCLDFDQINQEIIQAEKNLKENIKKLYDAEKKPEIRGFNLKSLSREERQEFDQLLEPYI